MLIGDRVVSPRHPPYIIAELGVNHDGSVDRALELTRAAAAAGADAVKLQLFETDRLMSSAAKLAAYQKAAGEKDPVSMLRRLEMGIDDMARVVGLAHSLGIQAIVTVFSVELVEVAEKLAWDAYKTASPDIVHRPLLEELAKTGKPMIVSTGAAELSEVVRAVDWLNAARMRDRLALMQCVSSYPTPASLAELGGIAAIQGTTDVPVGYSDHTSSERMGRWAVLAGACLLEKHMTYDRAAIGPDHSASLDGPGMRRYVAAVREVMPGAAPEPVKWADDAGQGWSGPVVKRVLEIEQDVRTVSRQSIVTTRALRAGDVLRREDVTFKRPGTGMLPFRLAEVIGRGVAVDVAADVPVMEAHLANIAPRLV